MDWTQVEVADVHSGIRGLKVVDDRANLDGRLREVFASVFNLEREAISAEMSMRTFAGWDSLRQIQLVLALEDEFKVSFQSRRSLRWPVSRSSRMRFESERPVEIGPQAAGDFRSRRAG